MRQCSESGKDIAVRMCQDFGVRKTGGHYKYASGYHGPNYFAKEILITNPLLFSCLAKILAESFENSETNLVVGPVIGGALLAQVVAGRLTTKREVHFVPLEKSGDNLTIKPPYRKVVSGAKVLFVDDVLNRGHTFFQAKELVESGGGKIVGAGSIFSYRILNSETLGIPVESLIVEQSENYESSECPMCEEGIPIDEEFGHGSE